MLTTKAHIMHQLLKIHFYSNIPVYFAKYTLTIFEINHRNSANMPVEQIQGLILLHIHFSIYAWIEHANLFFSNNLVSILK